MLFVSQALTCFAMSVFPQVNIELWHFFLLRLCLNVCLYTLQSINVAGSVALPPPLVVGRTSLGCQVGLCHSVVVTCLWL